MLKLDMTIVRCLSFTRSPCLWRVGWAGSITNWETGSFQLPVPDIVQVVLDDLNIEMLDMFQLKTEHSEIL